jgi:Domain of unknown function (DUF4157)
MAMRSYSNKKLTQDSGATPVRTSLKSRPFAPPLKLEAEQAPLDLQTQLENAQRFGHHFGQYKISSRSSDLPPIQPKLTIGAPGDKYEQEADRVAQQVVQQLNAPLNKQSEQSVQRETLPEEEDELQMKPLADRIQRMEMPEEEEELQRKPDVLQRETLLEEEDELQMKSMVQRSFNGAMPASENLESAIAQARSSGQPLTDSIRQPMEQTFGADFSRVRIHADAQADRLNRSIQARAFTTGQDVFFRQGAYQPGSRGGQELLAHELTHVVQQNGGSVIQRKEIGESVFNFTNRTRELYKNREWIFRHEIYSRIWEYFRFFVKEEFETKKEKSIIQECYRKVEEVMENMKKEVDKGGRGGAEKNTEIRTFIAKACLAMDNLAISLNKESKVERKISIAGKVIDKDDNSNNKQLYQLVNNSFKEQCGDLWFNSVNELNLWMKNGGKLEGIGIWKGRFINLREKGPIVWGEHHDAGKMDFIKALNIEHYLVEGSSESTMGKGVEAEPKEQTELMKKLQKRKEVKDTGHELENRWVKLGCSVAQFWYFLPAHLRNICGRRKQTEILNTERMLELIEGIEYLKSIKMTNNKEDIDVHRKEIREVVIELQEYILQMEKLGWGGLAEVFMTRDQKKKESKLKDFAKEQKETKVNKLADLMTDFLLKIEHLGKLIFQGAASEEQKKKDTAIWETPGKDVLQKWALRREVFMLKSIQSALSHEPKPLLIVMGSQHAKNQQEQIEKLLVPTKGTLLIDATLDSLIEYGAKKKY